MGFIFPGFDRKFYAFLAFKAVTEIEPMEPPPPKDAHAYTVIFINGATCTFSADNISFRYSVPFATVISPSDALVF